MISLSFDHGIARLAMDHAPVNALTPALLAQLGSAVERLERDPDWRVLVIASGLDLYCAGGDLQSLARWLAAAEPGRQVGEYARHVQELFSRIEHLPGVTIAEIDGAALGGGLELALACDLRIATPRASFGFPELRIGLLPAAGGTQRLARACGHAQAVRLILGGETIDAETALRIGLVQWVVPCGELRASSSELAQRMARVPAAALRRTKSCIAAAPRGQDGYRAEVETISALAELPQARELVTAFIERSARAGTRA